MKRQANFRIWGDAVLKHSEVQIFKFVQYFLKISLRSRLLINNTGTLLSFACLPCPRKRDLTLWPHRLIIGRNHPRIEVFFGTRRLVVY